MAFSAFTQFEVSYLDSQSMCVSITGTRVLQYKGGTVIDYTWTGCPPFRFFIFPLSDDVYGQYVLLGAKQVVSAHPNLAW
jgi:hypothetical protein